MQDVYRRIDKVAPTAATVLIVGESGSGKEVVARTIHDRSERAQGAVRRGQLRRHPGQPDRGRALRLREGRVHRRRAACTAAASSAPRAARCSSTRSPRWRPRCRCACCACSRPAASRASAAKRSCAPACASSRRPTAIPRQAVADGHLREDLMYRLAVFPIALPPLREREGDAELLAEHFLAELNDAEGTDKAFSRQSIATIRAHRWPGNVRELKNAVQRAFILADDDGRPRLRGARMRGARRATACASRSARRSRKSSGRRSTPRSTCAKATSAAAPRCSASASRPSTTGSPSTRPATHRDRDGVTMELHATLAPPTPTTDDLRRP